MIHELRRFLCATSNLPDGPVLRALLVLGFFGFYRLATLDPNSVADFSKARFPTHDDVIWGAPVAHMITEASGAAPSVERQDVVPCNSSQDFGV